MKAYLDKIREPDKSISARRENIITVGIVVFGFLIGIVQKALDGTAINELPFILQQIDIINFFGRLAIWILLAVIISVYAKTPARASVNTFLFFISMVAGYYIYCNFVLGFLPRSYMMMWFAISVVSVVPAYICWYAKGDGPIAVIITAGILGVLLAQSVIITQGIYVTHLPDAVLWIIGMIVLRRKPKEFAVAVLLSIAVAFIYQTFIPYWG